MFPRRPYSTRPMSSERQLFPEQQARIQAILASLVRRGSQTITSTVRSDGSGNRLSVEIQRKRTPLRAGEINSWLRRPRQLAQHGLLPEDIEPRPHDLEGTVPGNELEFPWEKQLVANLKTCVLQGNEHMAEGSLIKEKNG